MSLQYLHGPKIHSTSGCTPVPNRKIEIEMVTFTPIDFPTSRGMGPEVIKTVKKLSAKKTNQDYSPCIAFISKMLRLDLLIN